MEDTHIIAYNDEDIDLTPDQARWMHLAALAATGSRAAAHEMTALLAVLAANVVKCHEESETRHDH